MRKLFVALFLMVLPLEAEITAELEGGNLRVEIGGHLFTEYRSDGHVPCLYPLMSLSGGAHLTRRFPFEKGVVGEESDHPHHAGFWVAHGDVNGVDFWHGKDGCRIVTKRFIGKPELGKTDDGGESIRFEVELDWVKGDGEKVLSEQRRYIIHVLGGTRVIDVTCHLQATEGKVVFGGTKEGSVAIRVAPTLRHKGEVAQGHLLNSEGWEDQAVWGKRARWAAFLGPDAEAHPTVIAMMDHSKNLRHPTWWHARDYGLLAANPFGAKDFRDKSFQGDGSHTLKAGDSLIQRYRLVLHQGDLESVDLEAHWRDFTD